MTMRGIRRGMFLVIAAVQIAATEPVQPPAQTAFVAAVAEARDQFKAAPNDMAKGAARAARKAAICRALPLRTARDWIGRIYRLSFNSDGNGIVEIAIGPDVYVTTWNNSLSDIGDNTLIPAGSPVFQDFVAMKTDDPVKFSGTFLPQRCRLYKRDQLDTGRVHDRIRVPAAVLRCQPRPVNRGSPLHGGFPHVLARRPVSLKGA
jgi:hypothetical protein